MAELQDKLIRANGLMLHYLDWGNTGAMPVVLLHGICGQAHYWDFFAAAMRDDYHILAIDQRGHGDSEWAQSYKPADYVLDLDDFTAKLGIRDLVLIGHSMGGMNALLYAARRPDQVAKLVIIDIGPEIGVSGIERILSQWNTVPQAFESLEEAARYMKQVEPRYSDAFVQHELKYGLRRDEQGRFVPKYDKALQNTELRSPELLWGYLEQTVCATLVLHGSESDILLPDVARRMGDVLPFGSVVEIDRAGHSIPGDNPQAFEAAVRGFLEERHN